MANPPKKKGTAAETELLRLLRDYRLSAMRTSPGMEYDIHVTSELEDGSVDALATRPDRGQWLVTIPLREFAELLAYRGYGARIEVKRYRRFALHTIFENKFGRKPSYRAEQLKGRDDV